MVVGVTDFDWRRYLPFFGQDPAQSDPLKTEQNGQNFLLVVCYKIIELVCYFFKMICRWYEDDVDIYRCELSKIQQIATNTAPVSMGKACYFLLYKSGGTPNPKRITDISKEAQSLTWKEARMDRLWQEKELWSFPPEILGIIFSFYSRKDLLNFSLVSKDIYMSRKTYQVWNAQWINFCSKARDCGRHAGDVEISVLGFFNSKMGSIRVNLSLTAEIRHLKQFIHLQYPDFDPSKMKLVSKGRSWDDSSTVQSYIECGRDCVDFFCSKI